MHATERTLHRHTCRTQNAACIPSRMRIPEQLSICIKAGIKEQLPLGRTLPCDAHDKMGKASGSAEADYRKLLSRNDELTKQEATLKKEYTTLLRKISSLCSVLDHLESDIPDEPGTLSEKALKRVPGLQWHNDQVNLLQAIAQQKAEITIPVELIDSYKLYKGTPLLHRDIQ